MRIVPIIFTALVLGGCVGPGAAEYQTSRVAPDCGVAARALRPMVVTVEFVDREQMPQAAEGVNLQRANSVHGFIQTLTFGNVRSHRITAPLPRTEADHYAWRVLFHELRHANGEVHDARGCWLPGSLPASPNERVTSLQNPARAN
jgi:hypothetical protein